MSRFALPESLKNSERVFEGARFDVHQIELVGHHGGNYRREVVVHPGAVVILPIIDNDTIVLIQNYRFAVDKILWELPAGTLEPSEAPIDTAYRELLEETGYIAAHLHPLLDFYTSPGICNEKMFAFVANDLTQKSQNLDETEEIIVKPMRWDKIFEMIKTNEICDGKTIATLLFYHHFYRK